MADYDDQFQMAMLLHQMLSPPTLPAREWENPDRMDALAVMDPARYTRQMAAAKRVEDDPLAPRKEEVESELNRYKRMAFPEVNDTKPPPPRTLGEQWQNREYMDALRSRAPEEWMRLIREAYTTHFVPRGYDFGY